MFIEIISSINPWLFRRKILSWRYKNQNFFNLSELHLLHPLSFFSQSIISLRPSSKVIKIWTVMGLNPTMLNHDRVLLSCLVGRDFETIFHIFVEFPSPFFSSCLLHLKLISTSAFKQSNDKINSFKEDLNLLSNCLKHTFQSQIPWENLHNQADFSSLVIIDVFILIITFNNHKIILC